MRNESAFAALLEALYGGLTRSPPWEEFLRALAAATGSSFATLLIGRNYAGFDAHVTPGADPQRTQEYSQMSEADPFVGLPVGRVVSFSDFVDHIPARFQDWMDRAHTGQILGIDLERAPDTAIRLRLTRAKDCDDFEEQQKALLTRLIPHLQIALELHARLTTSQAESQLFSSAMADLAVATLILDRDGRILRRNAVATRMLEDGSVIAERNSRLEPRTRAASIAIDRILAAPPPVGEDGLFEVAISDGPSLHGRARAIPSSEYGDGAWLALFLADPARSSGPSYDTLREKFRLTPAEAALAVQLMEGASLADAAGVLDIAYNTARSHLRTIFTKTGTHRQAQLITVLRTIGSDPDV